MFIFDQFFFMKQPGKPSYFALDFLTLLQADVTHPVAVNLRQTDNTAVQRTDVDTSFMTPKVGRVTVYLAVKHVITINDADALHILVRYSAHFRQMGPVNAEELVRFAGVRAPELLFPFVREAVASLTAGTAWGPIFLDPVDFIRICNEKMPKN